tara:strand:+ start:426 stop:599 length:174 start_codon:yes stop_codon:yes gene_type:complete
MSAERGIQIRIAYREQTIKPDDIRGMGEYRCVSTKSRKDQTRGKRARSGSTADTKRG